MRSLEWKNIRRDATFLFMDVVNLEKPELLGVPTLKRVLLLSDPYRSTEDDQVRIEALVASYQDKNGVLEPKLPMDKKTKSLKYSTLTLEYMGLLPWKPSHNRTFEMEVEQNLISILASSDPFGRYASALMIPRDLKEYSAIQKGMKKRHLAATFEEIEATFTTECVATDLLRSTR